MAAEETQADMLLMIARIAAQKLIQSLRSNLFPCEETEKFFGIAMNDSENDGIGDMIYNAWGEIYQRRLYHGGETVYEEPGPASLQFEADLMQALASGRLAPSFRAWIQEVIDDHRFPIGVYCTKLQSRNLTFDTVIHPTEPVHRDWMERFHTAAEEGGQDAAVGEEVQASTPVETCSPSTDSTPARTTQTSNRFCNTCGAYRATSRCSSCKEVSYCNRDHQRTNWKKHKACCKAIAADPVSVWIEVQEGEGNGLGNERTNHIFANKTDGLRFAQHQLGPISPPLRSPLCELAGWDVEIYCSTSYNDVRDPRHDVSGRVEGRLNSAGVYLGCDLADGLTRYNNLSGPIFVTGRRQLDGKPLNKDVFWGLLNFIWDAMDLYDGTLKSHVNPTLTRWATRYKQGTWVPRGGFGGQDVYSDNIYRGSRDHR